MEMKGSKEFYVMLPFPYTPLSKLCPSLHSRLLSFTCLMISLTLSITRSFPLSLSLSLALSLSPPLTLFHSLSIYLSISATLSPSLSPFLLFLSPSLSFSPPHPFSIIFLFSFSHIYFFAYSTDHNSSIPLSGTSAEIAPTRTAGSTISSPSQRDLSFTVNDTFTSGKGPNGPGLGAGLGSRPGTHFRGFGTDLYSPIIVSAGADGGGNEIGIKKLEVLVQYRSLLYLTINRFINFLPNSYCKWDSYAIMSHFEIFQLKISFVRTAPL